MHDRCIYIGRQQQNQTPHNFVLTLCSSWMIRDYRAVLVTFSPSIWPTDRMCAIYLRTISFVRPSTLHQAHPLAFAIDGRLLSHQLQSPSPLHAIVSDRRKKNKCWEEIENFSNQNGKYGRFKITI